MMVYFCNPSQLRDRQEDPNSESTCLVQSSQELFSEEKRRAMQEERGLSWRRRVVVECLQSTREALSSNPLPTRKEDKERTRENTKARFQETIPIADVCCCLFFFFFFNRSISKVLPCLFMYLVRIYQATGMNYILTFDQIMGFSSGTCSFSSNRSCQYSV